MATPIRIGIRSVVIDILNDPIPADAEWGDPSLYFLGKFWWNYGGYAGKVEFINHAHNIFFPVPDQGADSWSYILRPGINATAHHVYNTVPGFDMKTATGIVNLGNGKVGGLQQIGPSGGTGLAPFKLKAYVNVYQKRR